MPLARRETDVVVAGTGLAGLVSAVRALEHDAGVIVLEKAPRMGGKTVLSAGSIMVDEAEEPQVDTYEPFEESIAWLEEQGVEVTEMSLDLPWEGKEIDTWQCIHHMADRIESMGGEILLETPFKELQTDESGEVTGAIAGGEDGPMAIDAPSVILATGGYNASEELIQTYITDRTDELVMRGDPWSTGDGFAAARDAGAKTTDGLGMFDGHPMLAPPAEYAPEEFEKATQYYGARAVAIDESGSRFIDESTDIFETDLINHMAKEVGGTVFLVIDGDIYDDSWVNGEVSGMIERAKEYGGVVLEADTLEELGGKLTAHGVRGDRAVETVREFNDAVASTDRTHPDPPRENYREPLDEAPFYAIDVRPGISYTLGGLDVNENAEVLCRAESTTRLFDHRANPEEHFFRPIKGLYAAGVDIGNPDQGYYTAGGLSLALVSGRKAGKHAAERARPAVASEDAR